MLTIPRRFFDIYSKDMVITQFLHGSAVKSETVNMVLKILVEVGYTTHQ